MLFRSQRTSSRAGGLELLRCRLDGSGDLGIDGQADAEMNVASGMPCALLVDTGPASIDTLAVEAAPANGYLNPRGRTGVIYRSAPWFKGEDDFTVALKGRVGSHRGAMQVHVRVTVQ